MVRKNVLEEILKRKAYNYINNKYGVRAAIYEKCFFHGRPDIVIATKTKKTIVCEVKISTDIVRKDQLENYMHISNLVIIFIEKSNKLEKHIELVPDECGIVIIDGEECITYREPTYIGRKGTSSSTPLEILLIKDYRKLKPEEFDRLQWFGIILYSRFFNYKTDSDHKIIMNKREYAKNYTALSKYIKKFAKRIGIELK